MRVQDSRRRDAHLAGGECRLFNSLPRSEGEADGGIVMRLIGFSAVLISLAGCTTGPRQSMFDPVGAAPVELLSPVSDPFLEPNGTEAPIQLPKLGPVSSAARQHMWRAANSLGPAPRELPRNLNLTDRKTPASEAITMSPGKHVDAKKTSRSDGAKGFVQLLPPPPDDAGGSANAPRESRFFELPPAPEN